MKFALKSVPLLADVGVLHGDDDGPRTPPRCLQEVRKSFRLPFSLSLTIRIYSMKYALKSVTGLADVGVPPEVGVGPRTSPRCLEEVWKKFQITILTIPSNINSMKYALKSVPGLADVRVPHGVGVGSRTSPRCTEEVWKKFSITCITMPNNIYFIEYAFKPVPVVADVGVPNGVGNGPVSPAPGSRSKKYVYHVDQHEKLNEFQRPPKGHGGESVHGTGVLFY